MAGFFGMFNFDKPGRGVEKDGERKRGFFLFFEIYLRKFWRISSLSLFFTPFALLAVLVYFRLGVLLQGFFMPAEDPQVTVWVAIYMALFFVCFLGAGPASAGQAYVLRNFARETHAWVWDDFWTTLKENLWKGLLIFCIDLVVTVFLVGATVLYFTKGSYMPMPPVLTTAFGFLALFALFIYFMMHFFLYPLMVTFDFKFGALVKTAFQLTVLKLPACFVIFAVSLAVFALFLYLLLINVGFIVLFAAIGFATVAFVYTFYSTSVMDKILDARQN